MGLRPEDMEDAALVAEAPQDRRLGARVDLSEALGSEILVHFSLDAPLVMTEDTRELARDAGADTLRPVGEEASGSVFVARLSPHTRAREKQDLVALDRIRLVK